MLDAQGSAGQFYLSQLTFNVEQDIAGMGLSNSFVFNPSYLRSLIRALMKQPAV